MIRKHFAGFVASALALAVSAQAFAGTVTTDVAKAVSEIKGGKISFRVDKAANLHAIIGKASFDAEKLAENYGALMDEIQRLKPSSAKGIYIKRATISTTSGPGIPVDGSVVKGYTE